MVDARYEDFFAAAEKEIREQNLTIPVMEGTFGICWEEWAAHLAGLTAQFRQAERLLRLAEAGETLRTVAGHGEAKNRDLIRHGFVELLRFAEHDFGGTDRRRAALSAGTRADAVTEAADIARSLQPEPAERTVPLKTPARGDEFSWRGGRVLDPNRCCVAPWGRRRNRGWRRSQSRFWRIVHARYRGQAQGFGISEVLPSSAATNFGACVALEPIWACGSRRTSTGPASRWGASGFSTRRIPGSMSATICATDGPTIPKRSNSVFPLRWTSRPIGMIRRGRLLPPVPSRPGG